MADNQFVTARRTVGAWVLEQKIGRGSFAVVWKARHRSTGQVVAIKEIATDKLNQKLKQSLECEISILKRVEHRNIVRLYDTHEVNPERTRLARHLRSHRNDLRYLTAHQRSSVFHLCRHGLK